VNLAARSACYDLTLFPHAPFVGGVLIASSTSGSHCVHFYEPSLFPAKHIADFIRKGIAENAASFSLLLTTTSLE
jgi:hypothetical protein